MSDKSQPPAYESLDNYKGFQVCSMSLNGSDRINLYCFPIDAIDSTRAAITSIWGTIQKESDYYGTHEFKLTGRPWSGGQGAIKSNRLLVEILKAMAQLGWNLMQAAHVCNAELMDKDMLFFEKRIADPKVDLFAISFANGDRIRIIDAPSFVACVTNALKSQLTISVQNQCEYYGSVEFKLSGLPWLPTRSERCYSQALLCAILENIQAKGYKLYGSVNVATGFFMFDKKSLIFRRVSPAWN